MIAEWVNLVYIWQWLLVVHLFEADLTQRAFCSWFFSVSTLCSSCCLLFPAPNPLCSKDVRLRTCFSIQRFFFLFFFYPLCSIIFFYTSTVCSRSPSPPLSMLSPASMAQPCLSCSRFSFCWRVLIGLKWVTCPITQSFKPSLNVSVSWGSGGALWFCLPPLWQPSRSVEKPQAWWGGKGLARRKIRRIMSALITMYTKTVGSVRAQTEQLSQIGWARGFSASTLTLISLCALRLPTFRRSRWVSNVLLAPFLTPSFSFSITF